MMPPSLSTRERAALKARAHALEPSLFLGKAGLSPAVIAEAERVLTARELIKVKIADDDREAREATGSALADTTGAAVVARVGKVLILWRPRPADMAD
jgi:RNA-binding protein